MDAHDIHIGQFYWVQVGAHATCVRVLEASPLAAEFWLCSDPDGEILVCELKQFLDHDEFDSRR